MPEQLKTWEISFSGRKVGAIGVVQRFHAQRTAENRDLAILALYDEYEHISGAQVRLIEPPKEDQDA